MAASNYYFWLLTASFAPNLLAFYFQFFLEVFAATQHSIFKKECSDYIICQLVQLRWTNLDYAIPIQVTHQSTSVIALNITTIIVFKILTSGNLIYVSLVQELDRYDERYSK